MNVNNNQNNQEHINLPPEVWTKIIKYVGSDKEVAQLRLVSSCLRDIVDKHYVIEQVSLDGNVPQELPHPHVKIGSIKTMRNFTHPSQLPLYDFNRLKVAKFTGRCHYRIVQAVLDRSPQMEEIEMESDVFSSITTEYKLSGLVQRPQNQNKKIKKLKISKSFHLENFMSPSLLAITSKEYYSIKFAEVLKNSFLHPKVHLPNLTTLHVQYYGMPLNILRDLTSSALIPFIKHHESSLQKVKIVLTMVVQKDESTLVPFNLSTLPTTTGRPKTKSSTTNETNLNKMTMPNLCHLELQLPEAVLYGVLVELYQFRGKFIQSNKLTHLIFRFAPPFAPANVVQGSLLSVAALGVKHNEDGKEILQHLISKNQASLIILQLENFSSNQILLFDRVGSTSKSFENLTELSIGGRVAKSYPVNDNPDVQRFQNLVLEQHYPKLEMLSLVRIGVKLNLFTHFIKKSCPKLKNLTLTRNVYHENHKIDMECLSCIASKRRILNISVSANDLCQPFHKPYWNMFKNYFSNFQRKGNDNAIFVNL